MKNLLQIASDFIRDEEGLTMVEYAVAGALITGLAVTAFTQLGGAVQTEVGRMTTAIGGGGGAG